MQVDSVAKARTGPRGRPQTEAARSRSLATLGLLVVSAVGSAAMAARYVLDRAPGNDAALRAMPLDDAYIHLVYARSIAEEGGFFYNPGQPAVGATSPLWAIVLSGLFVLKTWGFALPTVEAVKVVGLFCAAAQAFAGGLFARRVTDSSSAGYLAVALLVLEPMLAFASVSGMELPLAGALTLLGLHALVSDRTTWAALWLGLAPLARPELWLLVPLVPLKWVDLLACRTSVNDPPASGRRLLAQSGLQSILLLAPSAWWVITCLRVTGKPLATTFYAKHQALSFAEQFSDVAHTLSAFTSDMPVLAYGIGFVPLVLGALAIMRATRTSNARPPLTRRWLGFSIAALPLGLSLGVLWAHDLRQPLAFYWARYFLLAVPLAAVWIAIGVSHVIGGAAREAATPQRASAYTLVAAFGALVLWLTVVRVPVAAERFAWNSQNILEAQVTIGRWAARHVPPGRTIATVDAGAVRYYSHRRTVDINGLNDIRVLEQGVNAVFQQERPLIYVVFPSSCPTCMTDPTLETVFETRSPHYTICDCPQAHMVVRARTSQRSLLTGAPAPAPR